jgi:REP element-mobilizing transposase RayT
MTNIFYEAEGNKQIYQRNLPHWDQGQKLYFVTFRLADSIPEQAMKEIEEKRKYWLTANLKTITPAEEVAFWRLFNRKLERWLDDCHGACVLADSHCATIVSDALNHFDRKRYRLDHWVIMPNHVHLLVLPSAGHSVDKILHSWKSFSANKINELLKRQWTLWRTESFDCIVRSPAQLHKFRQYIIDNAKKAAGKAVLSTGKWDD